ncbi:c-type cytochrome [Hymenobacter aquaticus]|uniref:C-type cytochrome n=2 Tax=Hymenobacter aquaticus TaxID=1867101 RepID=A0A4Z0QAF9_9BACT|nr:c-type cytochrome [Hymenobacter aquaticus]
MAAIVVAIGFLLLGAAGLVSIVPADVSPLAHSDAAEAGGCGVTDFAVTDSAALQQALRVPTGGDSSQVAIIWAGQTLFNNNCAQCHALADVVVGPALLGITERRPVSWIIPWVKNSSKMVAAGDEYAVKIFNQYQKQQMPSFQLSDREIESIVAYIEATTDRASAVAYAPAAR